MQGIQRRSGSDTTATRKAVPERAVEPCFPPMIDGTNISETAVACLVPPHPLRQRLRTLAFREASLRLEGADFVCRVPFLTRSLFLVPW